ncbi:hypothetical protein C725_1348 [Pacificimonas flava]|uniref:Uncharacterized protein n=1 Tax=Pacificimonas flava TaxID=1234595 RepID=M2U5Z8_9SPHN|nr:hypothetical protein C725_1348 [Pacificimonas flava]
MSGKVPVRCRPPGGGAIPAARRTRHDEVTTGTPSLISI